MPNIKKEIETLKAKLARLEQEQQEAERESQALSDASDQFDKILEEQGISLEAFIAHDLKKFSRIVNKLEKTGRASRSKTAPRQVRKKVIRKKRAARKTTHNIKIPAGTYAKLPNNPEQVFKVKEKGPRPKALKEYAEQVGLEKFLEQCRID
ncbi:MAG: hypothetical protein ABW076_11875 [Candidatus Thiodiazotropha sp.]